MGMHIICYVSPKHICNKHWIEKDSIPRTPKIFSGFKAWASFMGKYIIIGAFQENGQITKYNHIFLDLSYHHWNHKSQLLSTRVLFKLHKFERMEKASQLKLACLVVLLLIASSGMYMLQYLSRVLLVENFKSLCFYSKCFLQINNSKSTDYEIKQYWF